MYEIEAGNMTPAVTPSILEYVEKMIAALPEYSPVRVEGSCYAFGYDEVVSGAVGIL
jgi:hypothetical protein